MEFIGFVGFRLWVYRVIGLQGLGLGDGGFPINWGYHCGDPHNADDSTLGSILGFLYSGKLAHGKRIRRGSSQIRSIAIEFVETAVDFALPFSL